MWKGDGVKVKKTVKLDVSVVDFAKALSYSDDQAVFFNRMAHEFAQFSEGDKDGIQMLYIKKGLTAEAIRFIKKLGEYVGDDI